jgi:hypothetical protein
MQTCFRMHVSILLLAMMLRSSRGNRAGECVAVDGLQARPSPPRPSPPPPTPPPLCAPHRTAHPLPHQAPFNTSDPADPGYIFFSPSLKSGSSWCRACPSRPCPRHSHFLRRFEFGSAVTVELWLQTTRVFFGTSIVAGVIGCLVWQVAALVAPATACMPFNTPPPAPRWFHLGLRPILEQRQRVALGGGAAEWADPRPRRPHAHRPLDARGRCAARGAGQRRALHRRRRRRHPHLPPVLYILQVLSCSAVQRRLSR